MPGICDRLDDVSQRRRMFEIDRHERSAPATGRMAVEKAEQVAFIVRDGGFVKSAEMPDQPAPQAPDEIAVEF